MSDSSFTLCDTQKSVDSAIPALAASKTLCVDLEGTNLGKVGGTLSVISIHSLDSSIAPRRTFLFDTDRLSFPQLQPVFGLLQSTTIRKVLYDGRMDSSCLHHQYGVDIHSVIDLQLVDIVSREDRGEDSNAQLARLSPYLTQGEVRSQPRMYTMVQKINGLKVCVKEHEIDVGKGLEISGASPFPYYLLISLYHCSRPCRMACSSTSTGLQRVRRCWSRNDGSRIQGLLSAGICQAQNPAAEHAPYHAFPRRAAFHRSHSRLPPPPPALHPRACTLRC